MEEKFSKASTKGCKNAYENFNGDSNPKNIFPKSKISTVVSIKKKELNVLKKSNSDNILHISDSKSFNSSPVSLCGENIDKETKQVWETVKEKKKNVNDFSHNKIFKQDENKDTKSRNSNISQKNQENPTYAEKVELLMNLQNSCSKLFIVMDDFLIHFKNEIDKMFTSVNNYSRLEIVKYTGKGVIFHLEKKWGIIDLGDHDHVFFDLSIMLGNVEDLREFFRIGENLAFEAVKAVKPSRANWKATSIWKIHNKFQPHKPNKISQSITPGPLNFSKFAQKESNSLEDIPLKRPISNCESSPLVGSWRRRKEDSISFPISPTLFDPFKRIKKTESFSFKSNAGSSTVTPQFSKISDIYFNGNKRLSPSTFFKIPNFEQSNLPTLNTDDSILDEYNSKKLFKKQQQQFENQKRLEQKLADLQEQHDLLKKQLQRHQPKSSENSPSELVTIVEPAEDSDDQNLSKKSAKHSV